MKTLENLNEDLLQTVKSAKRVTVLTGAGVSAESGVPTFRGDEGLWNNYRAQDLATPEAFERDPELVWRWYDWRRTLIAPLKPNPGHEALVKFENIFDEMTLITQNVDGLHRKAGSRDPVEMHGNIWLTRCTSDGKVTQNLETPLNEIPPKCVDCGALLRPHIVWFGESLSPSTLDRAFRASENCDLFFVIGTSALVHPAASLAGVAKRGGAAVIEINLERTPISSDVDATLLGASGKILPEIMKIF